MNLIEILKSSIKQFFSFLVYFISFCFPRNKKLWLYGNLKGTFRDNAKHLFIYNSVHFPEIKHIWISQSKDVVNEIQSIGLLAIYKYSFAAFYYGFTAKVYIYNAAPTDVMHGCMRGSAFLLNLWHGVPFKKIEYDITKGSNYRKFFNPVGFREKMESFLFEPKTFRNSDCILAPSPKLVSLFSGAFRMLEGKIFVGPYPRNEVLKISADQLADFIDKYESPDFKEVVAHIQQFKSAIIYMPTFRDDSPDFMNLAIPNFEKLNNLCKKTNTLFLIKAHIHTVFNVNVSAFSNIQNLSSNIDIYPLLPYTHALISDYSSIIFDYSLLDKKIIFYAFDKDEYLSKSRESYFLYEEVFSKDIVKDFESLLNQIEVLNPGDKHEYKVTKAFVDCKAGMNSIGEYIKETVGF